MKEISQSATFGTIYDSSGGSGGEFMVPLTSDGPSGYRIASPGEWVAGWARNPNYAAPPVPREPIPFGK